MKRFALALTAVAATVAIAPYADANTNVTELRPVNLTGDAVSADYLQGDISEASTATAPTPDTARVDTLSRENLDDAAATLDGLRPENLDRDSVLEVFVIDL